MLKQRRRCGGTGASIYLCFLFRTGGFCSSKICICAVPTSQNSPVLLPQKRICRHTLPCCRVHRQLLSRVSRKQRSNTLDFPTENRVPTGMLRAPIGNPASKGYSLLKKSSKPVELLRQACCFLVFILFPNENAQRCEANFSFWLTGVERSVAALR